MITDNKKMSPKTEYYSDQEIKEAVKFVIRDNPGRKWSGEKELADAVENYLAENTVMSHLEECIKLGLVEEIAPNRFVPTKKGLELAKELEKEKEDEGHKNA